MLNYISEEMWFCFSLPRPTPPFFLGTGGLGGVMQISSLWPFIWISFWAELATITGIAAILRFPLPDLEDIEMWLEHFVGQKSAICSLSVQWHRHVVYYSFFFSFGFLSCNTTISCNMCLEVRVCLFLWVDRLVNYTFGIVS